MLAWMRLLTDPHDAAAVVRALARPPIELRQVDLARVIQLARRRKLDMIAGLGAATESPQVPPEARERIEAAAKTLSADDQSLVAEQLRGSTISHPDWIRKSRVRGGLRARWVALFQDIDVMLCPPMPTVAFPHDHAPRNSRQLEIDGAKIPYFDQMAWSGIATLNGLPATIAPIGRGDGGLPIGVQIIGNYLEDRTTIAFAGLIEREFGGFAPPP